MSNYKAIAAVTAALRNLLSDVDHGLPKVFSDVKVTTKPLDKAREGIKANQLNVYLYQFLPNPQWRNMPDPGLGHINSNEKPPVALDLYYLLTGYGEGDDVVKSHELMGKAMDIMHNNPRLPVEELQLAVEGNDLFKDAGLITIVPQFLPLEELSKFWTSASTGFRLSMVYKISVVLIASQPAASAGLPTFREPKVGVMPALNRPTLTNIAYPNGRDRAQTGDTLTVSGFMLGGSNAQVLLDPPGNADPIAVKADRVTEQGVTFTVPQNLNATGRYRLWVQLEQDSLTAETNALVFALAPRILRIDPVVNGDPAVISITCEPPANPAQHVFLLVGERFAILKDALTQSSDRLSFVLQDPPSGEHFLRLRVNGIDSLLIDFSTNPPQFNQQLKVTLT